MALIPNRIFAVISVRLRPSRSHSRLPAIGPTIQPMTALAVVNPNPAALRPYSSLRNRTAPEIITKS